LGRPGPAPPPRGISNSKSQIQDERRTLHLQSEIWAGRSCAPAPRGISDCKFQIEDKRRALPLKSEISNLKSPAAERQKTNVCASLQNAFGGTRIIRRSRSWRWLRACRRRRGKTSLGDKAQNIGCVRALLGCVSVRRVGTKSAASHVRRNGCSSSGPREKPSPPSIGCPPCRRRRKSGTWSAWPSSAGSSSTTTKN